MTSKTFSTCSLGGGGLGTRRQAMSDSVPNQMACFNKDSTSLLASAGPHCLLWIFVVCEDALGKLTVQYAAILLSATLMPAKEQLRSAAASRCLKLVMLLHMSRSK